MEKTRESRTRIAADYEALVEFLYLTPVGIIKFRPDGKVQMANPAAVQLLMPLAVAAKAAVPDGGMSMANFYTLFDPVAPDLREGIQRFAAPFGQICDQRQVAVPGTRSILTLSINKIDPRTLVAVVQDITRGIEQESRIRDDQQRFHAIFENVRDYAIATVDINGRIEEWNRSLNRLGGWDAADVVGAPIGVFFPRPDGEPAPAMALLDRARQQGTAEFEGWGVRKDGSTFWGNTVATVLPDHEGNANGFVLITRDLTERKQMEDRLTVLATSDPLTGVRNRRAGEAMLDEAFVHWRRYGRPFAVLMIDCDHFKLINDTWGHEIGDDVLRLVVRTCSENLRSVDVTIRWGGEEFLLFLPETSRDTAHAVAERLRTSIEAARTERDGCVIPVTVSVGVAEVGAGDAVANDVVRRADQALYAAKHTGRNRVVAD